MHQPAFRPSPAYAKAVPNIALTTALEGLASHDFQRQWEAAKQLREIGEAAIAPLVELTQDDTVDEGTRWFAARALGDFDHPQAIAALAHLLNDEDEDISQIAATALAQIGASAIHPLTYLLQSDSTRLLAVQALARIRQRRTILPLLRVVSDRDPKVRQMAIEALASFQDSRILPVLIAALDDPVAGIRQEAVTALGLRLQLRTWERTGALGDSDNGDSDNGDMDGNHINNHSLETANSGYSRKPDLDMQALELRLAACLHDFHLDVCIKAAIALGRWGSPYAVERLGTVLNQPHTPEALKIALIQALGWVPSPAAVDAITQALTLPQVQVRCEAIRTLSTFEPEALVARASQALLAHLEPLSTVSEKQAIALALARLGCDQAIDGILVCLADTHEGVQLHAIAALKQLNTFDVYQYLQHLSQQPELPAVLRSGVQKALDEW